LEPRQETFDTEPPSDARLTHLVQLGLAVLKNTMLINGGACVAVFTLIGHAATSLTSKLPVASFGVPLGLFASGLLAATLASGAGYFSEGYLVFGRHSLSKVWAWIAVGLAVLSLILFFVGSCVTYSVIVPTPKNLPAMDY